MSSPAAQTQWYIARDGQQYGPLSEAELGRFVDLGHLQPTDLLWREGFPDWRPAMVVFPPRAPGLRQPSPVRPTGPAATRSALARQAVPARAGRGAYDRSHDPDAAPRARGLKRTLLAITLVALLALGGWYGSTHKESLLQFMRRYASWIPVGLFDKAAGKATTTA